MSVLAYRVPAAARASLTEFLSTGGSTRLGGTRRAGDVVAGEGHPVYQLPHGATALREARLAGWTFLLRARGRRAAVVATAEVAASGTGAPTGTSHVREGPAVAALVRKLRRIGRSGKLAFVRLPELSLSAIVVADRTVLPLTPATLGARRMPVATFFERLGALRDASAREAVHESDASRATAAAPEGKGATAARGAHGIATGPSFAAPPGGKKAGVERP